MDTPMKSIRTQLAGVMFGDAQQNIKKFGHKDVMWYGLVREPDNPHDPNAVRVVFAGLFMGYIPKDIAIMLAQQMDNGIYFMAKFVRRRESPVNDVVGLEVEIVEVSPLGRSGK